MKTTDELIDKSASNMHESNEGIPSDDQVVKSNDLIDKPDAITPIN